jgi:hypothetical protein
LDGLDDPGGAAYGVPELESLGGVEVFKPKGIYFFFGGVVDPEVELESGYLLDLYLEG